MATSTKTPYDSDADEKHAPKSSGDMIKDGYRDAGAVGDPKSYSARPSDKEKRQAAAELDRGGGYYAPGGDEKKKDDASSGSSLGDKEKSATGDDFTEQEKQHYRDAGFKDGEDGGWYLEGKVARGSRLSRAKSARKVWKKYAVGGGIAASIVGIVFAVIGFFLPLKLEFIIGNLSESLSATTDYAVGERVDALVGRYMTLKIFGATASENIYIGNTLTGTIYGNWLKSNLEVTLRDKHGIEFRALDSQNRPTRGTQRTAVKWQAIAKGRTSPFINTTSVNLKRLDAREFRQVVKQAIRYETRWNQVIKRYHMWRVIRSAYAVPNRLIPKFATEARASYTEKKIAIKKWLVQRTVTPFSNRLGALMGCMVDARTCNDIIRRDTFNRSTLSEQEINAKRAEINDLDRQIAEIDVLLDDDPGGELRRLEGEKKLITDELRASGLSDVDVDRVIRETFDELGPDAAKREVYRRLSKVLSSKLTKGLLITVSGLGLVDLLSDIDRFFSDGGANKAMYQMQSLALINQTAPFLTAASQLKLGDLPAEDLGILLESFDNFEKSAVYQVENGLVAQTNPLAFWEDDAQALAVIPYDCDGDGEIAEYTKESVDYVTLDEPVCAGMQVGKDMRGITKEPWYANTVGVFFDIYQKSIGGFVGWVVDLFDAAVGFFIEPILEATGASKALASGMEYVLERVVSPACNGLEEGALAYDCLRGGLELANNVVNEEPVNGTAGEYLRPEERNAVVAHMQAQYDEEWRQQPLFARLFSTDSHRSLLAQAIVRTPSGAQSALSNMASVLASPFKALGSVFGSLTSPIFARSADLPADWNPYGVVHYGYRLNDESLADEPGTGVFADCKTDDGVADSLERRERSLKVPEGAPDYMWEVYTEPDYCALEKTAIEAASALLGGGI